MFFIDKYKFLSNFSLHPIVIDGVKYKTVEHYYQAMKTSLIYERASIISMSTPGKAKRAGRTITMRDGWDYIKDGVMYIGLKAKFDQNPKLIPDLLSIDEEIVEDNNWGDRYWGKVDGKGLNTLGNLLESIRDSYIEG